MYDRIYINTTEGSIRLTDDDVLLYEWHTEPDRLYVEAGDSVHEFPARSVIQIKAE